MVVKSAQSSADRPTDIILHEVSIDAVVRVRADHRADRHRSTTRLAVGPEPVRDWVRAAVEGYECELVERGADRETLFACDVGVTTAQYGIAKVLISSSVTKVAGLEKLRYMVEKGAFLEFTLAAYTHTTPIPKTHYYVEREYSSMDEGMAEEPAGGVRLVAEQIQALGADHCIIGTDFGVYTLPPPVEGLREFIACLLDLGIPADDIRKLVKFNPERLLGLGGQLLS